MPSNKGYAQPVENPTTRNRLLAFCSWMHPKKVEALQELFAFNTDEDLIPVLEQLKTEFPNWDWRMAAPPDITDDDPILKASQSRVPAYLKHNSALIAATKELLDSEPSGLESSFCKTSASELRSAPTPAHSVASPLASDRTKDTRFAASQGTTSEKPAAESAAMIQEVEEALRLQSPAHSSKADSRSSSSSSKSKSKSSSKRSPTPLDPRSRSGSVPRVPGTGGGSILLASPSPTSLSLRSPLNVMFLPLDTPPSVPVLPLRTSQHVTPVRPLYPVLHKPQPPPEEDVDVPDYISEDCSPNELILDSASEESASSCDTAHLIMEIYELKETLAQEKEVNKQLKREERAVLRQVRDGALQDLRKLQRENSEYSTVAFSNPTPVVISHDFLPRTDTAADMWQAEPPSRSGTAQPACGGLTLSRRQSPAPVGVVAGTPLRRPIITPSPPRIHGSTGTTTPLAPPSPGARQPLPPIPRSVSSLDLLRPLYEAPPPSNSKLLHKLL